MDSEYTLIFNCTGILFNNVRANVPTCDIIRFYFTCNIPVFEYCAPVFHHAFPGYLCNDLERVQKRALSIISPGLSYTDNLNTHNISTLKNRNFSRQLCPILITSFTIFFYAITLLIMNLRRQRRFDCLQKHLYSVNVKGPSSLDQ